MSTTRKDSVSTSPCFCALKCAHFAVSSSFVLVGVLQRFSSYEDQEVLEGMSAGV